MMVEQASDGTPGTPGGPLAHIPLFERLDPVEQTALFHLMQREAAAANKTICWHGDRGESLYVISRGRVAVVVPSVQGDQLMVDTLGPGGFFGEISLLDGGPRTATVRALEDTELLVLGQDDFQAFLRQRPDAAIDILAEMGHRHRKTTDALRGMTNPNVAFEMTRAGWWQRISDVIAMVAASRWFTLFHIVWFGGWMLVNSAARQGVLPAAWAVDPYPFQLLTMIVSLEAIFLSIFVLVSQNRQSEKDRISIDLDHQVNVKAQTEIAEIARRLDRIEGMLAPPPKS